MQRTIHQGMHCAPRMLCATIALCSAMSASAQLSGSGDRFLVVGENLLKGAPDGSFGFDGMVTGDLDCDGRDDLVVLQPGSSVNVSGNQISGGVVTVIPTRGLNGPSATASFEWHQGVAGVPGAVESADLFGTSATIADLNNDGCGDLFIGAPGEDVGSLSNSGAAYGFLGDATDVLRTDRTGIINGEFANERTGSGLVGRGGLFGRLFVSRSGTNATGPVSNVGSVTRHAFLSSGTAFLGGDDLLSDIRNLVGTSISANDRWGSEFVGAGSVVALRGVGAGEVSLITGIGSVEQRRQRLPSSDDTIAFGDFDGNGSSEFVQKNSNSTLSIYTLQGLNYVLDQSIATGLVAGVEFTFVNSVAIGDFNRDGFDDLAIGYPGIPDLTPTSGNVLVLRGSASGLVSSTPQRLHQGFDGLLDSSESSDFFGATLTVGDFNGDGTDDLAVGVPGEKVLTETRGGIHLVLGVPQVQVFANGFE